MREVAEAEAQSQAQARVEAGGPCAVQGSGPFRVWGTRV